MSLVTILDRWGARGGTAADLAAVNEIPLIQEPIIETDTGLIKIGDGVTHYNDLAYINLGNIDLSGRADGDVPIWDAVAGNWVVGSVDIAGDTHAATSKATPVDADEIPLADSAASWILKKLTWANLKATLKTYFDSLYVGGPASAVSNRVALFDGTTGKLIKDSGLTLAGTNTGDQAGVTAGSATAGPWVIYNGTTQASGQFDGGTSAPAHTTRLNYDGYLHATRFYGDGSNLTGLDAAVLGFTSLPFVAQPYIGRGTWGSLTPVPGAATMTLSGLPTGTTVGTGSGIAIASTNVFTRQPRFRVTSAAGAGNTAGDYRSVGIVCGDGGFFYSMRLGSADAASVANARCFYGLRAATSAPGNVDPSTLTDMICVGADSGEANLSIMHNDSSGTATKVALGASFPAHTLSADFYEIQFLCLPLSGVVQYHVRNISSGAIASGTISTNMPSASTLLTLTFLRNNGSTALAVRLDVGTVMLGYSMEG